MKTLKALAVLLALSFAFVLGSGTLWAAEHTCPQGQHYTCVPAGDGGPFICGCTSAWI